MKIKLDLNNKNIYVAAEIFTHILSKTFFHYVSYIKK